MVQCFQDVAGKFSLKRRVERRVQRDPPVKGYAAVSVKDTFSVEEEQLAEHVTIPVEDILLVVKEQLENSKCHYAGHSPVDEESLGEYITVPLHDTILVIVNTTVT